MSGTYTAREVARLFDISEGRLRYWDRSGFLSPTGHKSGRRGYTFQDLIAVRSAKTLIDKGVSLQRARKLLGVIQEKVPRSPHPLDRLRIMSDDHTVVVAGDDHEFEADSGQLLLDFEVKELEEEVVAELPRRPDREGSRTAFEWYLEGCRLDEDEETLARAEEAYLQAINLDPTLANAYTNLGNLMFRNGSVADARALYNKAVEVDPDQSEAHYNLGFLDFEEGLPEDAERRFKRAVELDSTFADAHFNLAMVLFRLERDDEARGHLESYLSLEPSGPWAELARERLED